MSLVRSEIMLKMMSDADKEDDGDEDDADVAEEIGDDDGDDDANEDDHDNDDDGQMSMMLLMMSMLDDGDHTNEEIRLMALMIIVVVVIVVINNLKEPLWGTLWRTPTRNPILQQSHSKCSWGFHGAGAIQARRGRGSAHYLHEHDDHHNHPKNAMTSRNGGNILMKII